MILSDARLAALDQLYALYDGLTAGRSVACRQFCAACCTRNVTLTQLEALRLTDGLDHAERRALGEKLAGRADLPRFVPKVTLNRLADICMKGGEAPEEDTDPAWGPCPLLENRSCPVYEARPFNCRCMSSITKCDDAGAAEMDDFTVTLNQVFLQAIEHLDRNGYSGNFTDVLTAVLAGGDGGPPSHGLISNSPITALLIPPEHTARIQPVLARIRAIFS